MADPPGPVSPGGPSGYTERYNIAVGKATAFDMSLTLDTSVTDASVVVSVDDGAGGWTALDTATASFVAATAKTLYTIFADYIRWTAAIPTGVRQFKVTISGGTPATSEVTFYTSFEVYTVINNYRVDGGTW